MFAQNDRSNYKLNIDQRDVGRLHDTIIFEKKYLVSYIKVKLSNNSAKALKYITYSCSWDELFHVDNKAIKVCMQPCDKNVPIIESLEAHKSTEFILPVTIESKTSNLWFKVGMNLFLANDSSKGTFLLPVENLNNVIWSNQIQLP